jgi:hypothetical protein
MRLEPRLPALALLVSVALPATALGEPMTIFGISTTGPANFALSIPTIETTDSSLDEAAIRALFAGTGTEFATSLARLSELDATNITIPEISFSYDIPDGTAAGGTTRATVVYRDLVMNNVVDGVAQDGASLSGIDIVSAAESSMTFGAMTTDLLDLGAILGFYGLDADASPDDAMKPIYRNFAFEGGTFAGPGVSCAIGGGSADEFSARPLKHSFGDLMLLTGEVQAAETGGTQPSPEVIAKLLAFYADFLRAFSSTPMVFNGLDCDAADPEGDGTIKIKSGAFTAGGFQPGIYPDFSFSDLAIEHSSEGFLRLGNFTFKPMDLNGPIDAILAAGDAIDVAWFDTNWRKLIPALEGFSLSDFAIDIVDESSPGERIVASVGALDLSLGQYINGVPTAIGTLGTDLKFKFPAGAVPELTALGLTEPSVDYELAMQWNETEGTISLHHLGFNVDDFGSFSIMGTIANATPELFSENMEAATQAAMGLTVTDLTIQIDNQGIIPALIAMTAVEQRQPPQMIHATMIGAATALPIALLGQTAEATSLAQALSAFATGTPQLSIKLTSIDPKGIGLAELMAAEENPAALQGKFTITATASGEPVPFVYPEIKMPETPATTPETQSPGTPPPVGGPARNTQSNPRTGATTSN